MVTLTGRMVKDVHSSEMATQLHKGDKVYLTLPQTSPLGERATWLARPFTISSDDVSHNSGESIVLNPGEAVVDDVSIAEMRYLTWMFDTFPDFQEPEGK